MTRRTMKIDPDFRPSPVRKGDELFPNGIFVFNITRMMEHLESGSSNMEPTQIDTAALPPAFSTVDESTVATADLNRPLVLAEIAPGRYNLIDGHHRAEKARRMGVKTLRAYRVNAEQHIAFLTSAKAYRNYVEYWNEKLTQQTPRRSTTRGALSG